MISRSRSGPTAAAMSIERTTSANSTVTCLYSAADCAASLTGVPHSLQNLADVLNRVPHDPHSLSSTPLSCHRWSGTVC